MKGTIHWLSQESAKDATINEYGYIFKTENVATLLEDDNFCEHLNENSLVVKEGCKIEASLENAKAGETFQFVRMGYFTKDSKNSGVFHQTAPLKSSYKA